MCWSEGLEAWRANIPTAKAMSGRVAIMRYMSWPTADWKVWTRPGLESSLGSGFGTVEWRFGLCPYVHQPATAY